MKIIFLNIWQGKLWKDLSKFLLSQEKNTDIFCFVEVSPSLSEKMHKLFPDHHMVYAEGRASTFDNKKYGQVVYVKKNILLLEDGAVKLYNQLGNDIGFLQHVLLKKRGRTFLVCNVDGKSKPGHKLDTPSRISQSVKITNFLKKHKRKVVLGGDFNLLPNTKSIKMIEDSGFVNLIKKFKIKTTRNEISWEYHNKNNDEYFVKQYFADYVFVSKDVKVKSFKVPDVPISDHLPLILDFELEN